MASVTLSGVNSVHILNETIYVLARSSASQYALYSYDLSLQNAKTLSFPTTYFADGNPIDFAVLENKIKVLKSNGSSATIDSFMINGDSLTQDALSSAVVSSLGFNSAVKDLLGLNMSGTEITLTYKKNITLSSCQHIDNKDCLDTYLQ